MTILPFLCLLPLFVTLAKARPLAASSSSCVGTISSLSDVDAAVQCKTVNINAFTVPAGKTFGLSLLQGSTVNVLGDIQFGNTSWSGPLVLVKGEDVTFIGNGKNWDGGGPFYWDGPTHSSGITKPDPMFDIRISGTLSDVHAVNSPKRCFAINSVGPLTVSGAVVDDSQGNYPNARSDGHPAGHNTDGFDVAGDDVVIKNSVVNNQDDCLAINRGKNITFEDNYCSNGHGVSIGSVTSNVVVENVMIQRNTVVDSAQAFRIKTDKNATNSRVFNVVYSGNTARNCDSYGVLISQSYPDNVGTPGNGVYISDISFSPNQTDVSVASDAEAVVLNCGEGSCSGIWDWSALITSGGKVGGQTNAPEISGYNVYT